MQGALKKMGAWGGLGALLYLGTCALMFAKQEKLLYQPVKKPSASKNDHDAVLIDDIGLSAWVDNPGQDTGIVYYGGASEPVYNRRGSFDIFPDATRYFVPYRGFWPNHGHVPNEKDLKDDAEKIFDYAQRHHKKVWVIGRSLGTSMAMHIAARKNPDRIVLVTPFYSILEIATRRYRPFPVERLLRDRHEAYRDAGQVKMDMPILTLLAEKDWVTPHESWRKMKNLLPSGAMECIVPKVNHITVVDSPFLWNEIRNFLL